MKRKILVILLFLSIAFTIGCTLRELAMFPVEFVAAAATGGVTSALQMAAVLSEDTVQWLGMKVHNINDSLSNQYGIDPNEKGVIVIRVKSESAAEQIGLIEGDLIKKINEYETGNIREFYKATKKVKKAKEVVFDIIRQGTFLTISTGPLKKK